MYEWPTPPSIPPPDDNLRRAIDQLLATFGGYTSALITVQGKPTRETIYKNLAHYALAIISYRFWQIKRKRAARRKLDDWLDAQRQYE